MRAAAITARLTLDMRQPCHDAAWVLSVVATETGPWQVLMHRGAVRETTSRMPALPPSNVAVRDLERLRIEHRADRLAAVLHALRDRRQVYARDELHRVRERLRQLRAT